MPASSRTGTDRPSVRLFSKMGVGVVPSADNSGMEITVAGKCDFQSKERRHE